MKKLALLLSLVSIAAAGDSPLVHTFAGVVSEGVNICREDIAPRHPPEWIYNWRYTFTLLDHDGSSLMIQFTYSKMTRLLDQYFYYFSFVDAEGKRVYVQSEVDGGEYEFDPLAPSMRMGRQGWSGFFPSYRLRIDTPELSADLDYDCRAAGWRPGTGPARFGSRGSDWFDHVVFIPWAEVSGTITVGGETRQVRGRGYADYTIQNMMLFNHIERIYSMASFSDGYSLCFFEHTAPEKYGNGRVGWMLVMRDGQVVLATDDWEREDLETAPDPRRGITYARRFRIKARGGSAQLEGVIDAWEIIEERDVLDMMPEDVHPYARRFRRPIYVRLRADAAWKLTGKGVEEEARTSGIMEACLVE